MSRARQSGSMRARRRPWPLQNYPEGDREVVHRHGSSAGCDGGWNTLDLDQRTVAGTRSRSHRGERSELRAISHSDRKSDQVDAEKLARYARLDPNILRPIAHRTVAKQEALTLIRARALLVRLRTAAVNAVRGLTKSCGYRKGEARCLVGGSRHQERAAISMCLWGRKLWGNGI